MRVIESKKTPATGERYHYCPKTQSVAHKEDCSTCFGGKTAPQIEGLGASYRVHCPHGEAVHAIIPSHVEDRLPSSWGTNKFALPDYSVIEPKLDGARAILLFTWTGIRVFSRRNNKFGDQSEFTDNVLHIARIRVPELDGTILDGEIICQKGAVSATGNIPAGTLGATMAVVGSNPDKALKTQETSGYAHVYIFDMPKYQNKDWTTHMYSNRRDVMKELLAALPPEAQKYLHVMPSYFATTEQERRSLYAKFLSEGAEGAVLKNPAAGYYDLRAGLKVKEDVTLDVLVTGYELGKRGTKYEHLVGALIVSVKDASTGNLVEVVTVPPGDDRTRKELTEGLEGKSPEEIAALHIIIWLQAQNWTKQARLRHPRILEYCQDRDVPSTIDFTQIVRK